MSFGNLFKRRLLLPAQLETVLITVMKMAGVPKVDQIRNLAGYRVEPSQVLPDNWFGFQQFFGIRMLRRTEQFVYRGLFYNFSCIHDDDIVGHFCNNSKIVGYKQNGSA